MQLLLDLIVDGPVTGEIGLTQTFLTL